MDSPFIENFLIDKSQENETSLLPSNLLCKYYEVNQLHLKAAKLKMKLAETPGLVILRFFKFLEIYTFAYFILFKAYN